MLKCGQHVTVCEPCWSGQNTNGAKLYPGGGLKPLSFCILNQGACIHQLRNQIQCRRFLHWYFGSSLRLSPPLSLRRWLLPPWPSPYPPPSLLRCEIQRAVIERWSISHKNNNRRPGKIWQIWCCITPTTTNHSFHKGTPFVLWHWWIFKLC